MLLWRGRTQCFKTLWNFFPQIVYKSLTQNPKKKRKYVLTTEQTSSVEKICGFISNLPSKANQLGSFLKKLRE